jgi:FkbM family methyltransferase
VRFLKSKSPEFVKHAYRRVRAALQAIARPRVAVCRVRGLEIKIGISSAIEQFRADSYTTKEPDTLDWLDRNLQDTDVLIDVGANIGLYSLYAARLNPHCRVYAFEPEAQNFARLCNNIALNALANVIPSNVPLTDRESFDFLYVGEMQAGGALHSFGQPSQFETQPRAISLKQGTMGMPLDDLVGKYNVPQPTLVKIDVDGFEEKVLAGAQHVLASRQLRSVLIEWNYRDDNETALLEQGMRQWGFKLAGRSPWIWEQDGAKAQNFVFQRG